MLWSLKLLALALAAGSSDAALNKPHHASKLAGSCTENRKGAETSDASGVVVAAADEETSKGVST